MSKHQDWFNGADYYAGSEQKVDIQRLTLQAREGSLHKHERIEMYYVEQGKGCVEVNGKSYDVHEGCFMCFYIYHFYRFAKIEEPLVLIRVSFHLGLFMFMGFEQHEGAANEALVYDTKPVQVLSDGQQKRIADLFHALVEEDQQRRFCSENMIVYLTMELHSLYCRYAYEGREKQEGELDEWAIIAKVLLETTDRTSLSDYSIQMQVSEATLNQKIKDTCGYTFNQLQQIAKISTACSLLHFPDLNISYISDYLGFNSVQDFHRAFERMTHQTPKAYQETQIMDQKDFYAREKLVATVQMIFVNVQDVPSLEAAAAQLDMKAATLQRLIQEHCKCTYRQMVKQIKVSLAKGLLAASDASIMEIATGLGYGSMATFQRQFKEITGKTASQYRDSLNKN